MSAPYLTFIPKVYRWPDSKPLPTMNDVYAAPRLRIWPMTHVRHWREDHRRLEIIQAFNGRRVAEIEISDRILWASTHGDHCALGRALENLAAALTPDALDIMYEAQVEPLPICWP